MNTHIKLDDAQQARLHNLLRLFLDWDDRADKAANADRVMEEMAYRQSAIACASEAFRLMGLLPGENALPPTPYAQTPERQVASCG